MSGTDPRHHGDVEIPAEKITVITATLCERVCLSVYTCVHICTSVCASTCVCIHVCVYLRVVCVHLRVCVCVCGTCAAADQEAAAPQCVLAQTG